LSSFEDSYFVKHSIKVPSSKVKFKSYKSAIPNKCELNAFNYAKENNMLPVWGIAKNENDLPIEHWWVFDPKTKTHIEISPVKGLNGDRYANIIKPDIFVKHDTYKEMMPIVIPRDTMQNDIIKILEEAISTTSIGLDKTSNYVGTNQNVKLGRHIVGRTIPKELNGEIVSDKNLTKQTKKRKKIPKKGKYFMRKI